MTKLLAMLGVVLLVAGGGAYGVYVSTCESAVCHSCCQLPAPVEPASAGCCDTSRAALLSGPVSCCESGEATKQADVSLEAVLGAAAVVARD